MPGIRDIWLYANNIIRSARQIVNEGLRPLNLGSAEGNILLHLLTQGQELRQEELVEQLDISKPAVSRALVSLEKKGYVVRKKDPFDKRASLVLLTGNARDIGSKVEQIFNKVFSIAASGLSEEEIKAFIELFGRVSESFSTTQAQRETRRGGRNAE